MPKKILFTLISLFLLYLGVNLCLKLFFSPPEVAPVMLVIWVAFLLNLYFTGVSAFLGFAWPTFRLLPKSYYVVKDASRLSKMYNALGVGLFRKGLMIAHWGRSKNRKSFFSGLRSGIPSLITETKRAEVGHLIPFIVIGLIAVAMAVVGLAQFALFTALINIISNLYPIILQRHHRMRIEQLNSK